MSYLGYGNIVSRRKLAGEVDRGALMALAQKVRAGDIANFEALYPDLVESEGIRKGLKSKVISGGISAAGGSPQHHTAMVHRVDPLTGAIDLVHNYEQGTSAHVSRVSPEQFDSFAKSRRMHFYRPRGATAEQGISAAATALAAAERKAPYIKSDLIGMALREGNLANVSSGIPGLTGAGRSGTALVDAISHASRGMRCDPASGVCSHLPTHAWGATLGGEDKAIRAMGRSGAEGLNTRLGVTPASIAQAGVDGRLDRIGVYTPQAASKSMLGSVGKRLIGKLKALKGVRV